VRTPDEEEEEEEELLHQGRRSGPLVPQEFPPAPGVAKSARYAPVADIQAVRRRQAWDEIKASPNPDTREFLIKAYFGGDAA